MGIRKYITIATIITSILVTSCSYPKDQASFSSQDPVRTVETPISTTNNINDKKSIEYIMNNQGLIQCEKITVLENRENCIDNALYSKAALAKNSKLCNEIKNKKILGVCIANSVVASTSGENTSPCNMIDREIQKSCIDSLSAIEAFHKMDPILCANIADLVEQKNCRTHIFMTQAIKNKDPSICTKLDDVTEQKNCNDILMQQAGVKMILDK